MAEFMAELFITKLFFFKMKMCNFFSLSCTQKLKQGTQHSGQQALHGFLVSLNFSNIKAKTPILFIAFI